MSIESDDDDMKILEIMQHHAATKLVYTRPVSIFIWGTLNFARRFTLLGSPTTKMDF